MEITVSARHTEVKPALREAVEDKLGRLLKKRNGLLRADVHFTEDHNPRISEPETCEITLEGRGTHLHTRTTGSDGFVALDRAIAKLGHQLAKTKTQQMRRRSSAARRSEARRAALDGRVNGSNAVTDEPPGAIGRATAYSRAPRFRRAV